MEIKRSSPFPRCTDEETEAAKTKLSISSLFWGNDSGEFSTAADMSQAARPPLAAPHPWSGWHPSSARLLRDVIPSWPCLLLISLGPGGNPLPEAGPQPHAGSQHPSRFMPELSPSSPTTVCSPLPPRPTTVSNPGTRGPCSHSAEAQELSPSEPTPSLPQGFCVTTRKPLP